MNVEQNLENNTPKIINQQKIQLTDKTWKFDQIYDDDFVSFINGLNESIKEYYKVSKNNIIEANTFLSYYQKQGQEIQSLIDEIKNSNSYQRIDEILEQIPKIDEIIDKLNEKILDQMIII